MFQIYGTFLVFSFISYALDRAGHAICALALILRLQVAWNVFFLIRGTFLVFTLNQSSDVAHARTSLTGRKSF